MLFTVPSNFLKAVGASCAAEDNPRSYLRYIHIDSKEKVLVGTNGVVLTTAPIGDIQRVRHGFEKFLPFPLPVTLEPYAVEIDTEKLRAKFRERTHNLQGANDVYPDWKKVWNTVSTRGKGVIEELAFDPRPLDKIARILSNRGHTAIVLMEFGKTPLDPVHVRWSGQENRELKTLFMPCRI